MTRGFALAVLVMAALACDPGQPASAPSSSRKGAASAKLDAALVGAFRSVKEGRYAEAERAVESYLKTPGSAHPGQAEFLLGLSCHERQLYETARMHFARAVELEPDYATTSFFYGFTLFNLGRLDAAKQQLEQYVASHPDEAEASFGLGLIALEQDRVDQAAQHIEQAIALAQAKATTPELPPALREDVARYQARLGDVFLRCDDLPRARAAFERSVALWPDHFEPWHKLARVLERLGDHAGAERAQATSDAALVKRTRGGKP